MPMTTLHEQAVFEAGFRAIRHKIGLPHSLPHGSVMTALMKHGGLYTLLDSDLMSERIQPMMAGLSTPNAERNLRHIQALAESFFYRLVDRPGYMIPGDLESFITFPHDGLAYEKGEHLNPTIPAVFTFVGQFIDHDLTMNAVNLTLDENGMMVPDNASPIIDLDSVYGPRDILNNTLPDPSTGRPGWDIFNDDGTFKLDPIKQDGKIIGYDLPRFSKGGKDIAYIIDARNDENQMILQLHILVMRVHNALVPKYVAQNKGRQALIEALRKEVVRNWQSVVLHDWMPRIIQKDTLEFILTEIKKSRFGSLKHKPVCADSEGSVVNMPHEFAIGYRFGHSMLRDEYVLNGHGPIPLFNNRRVHNVVDLRGSTHLQPEHVIDWDVFYPDKPSKEHLSSRIDGLVTPPVFDLPQTTIPDDIKDVGNLPLRNLVRSKMIGVVSGEEVAKFYGVPVLKPAQIVDMAKYPQAKDLFSQQPDAEFSFKTPLWYYILKEAEITTTGESLGPLGSRLVGEVLVGAIYYDPGHRFDDNWKSSITGKNEVTLRDLIKFVKSTA
jgi:hypothetical protein